MEHSMVEEEAAYRVYLCLRENITEALTLQLPRSNQ